MQETTLYLVRHGETEYNRRQIMQGRRINSSLNATGRRQAEALGRRFADVPLDALYTSSLRRAIETADAVAAHHEGIPRYRLEDLDEMSWGVYEGEARSPELQAFLDEIRGHWDRGHFGYCVEEGESILDVQTRGLRAIEHIVTRHPGETVLVVSHGRFLRVLLASLLEAYGLARMDEIPHANTGVNNLVYAAGRYEATLLNCTAHLDEVENILVE